MHANQPNVLAPEARDFYCRTLGVLSQSGLEFLIGGAYAFERYTGIERHTKDIDIFVRERDFQTALEALERAGYSTQVTFAHWLGKATCGEYFVDLIYSSGNGLAPVDEDWFRYARPDYVLEVPVRLCPPEEMIFSKTCIQERERFDGADVAHLLHSMADDLDWERLVGRFGDHWRVLLAHLVLFGFIYPSERKRVPALILDDLLQRLQAEHRGPPASERVCRGTLLSRQQYLVDVTRWGYVDARRKADNPMTDTDIRAWTAGISRDGSPQS